MAFSFGAPNAFGAPQQLPGNAHQVSEGPELPNIETNLLRFLALGGEAKVQLLPTPWPRDNLPPSSASLLSVASYKGLVAAAGPESVIIATTEAVRKAFEAPQNGDGQIRAFQPQLTLPLGMRVSQVAFTADEDYLVISAETGGGLAVYEVQSLLNGSQASAFELPTNSQSLRALVPNPTPEKGELLALVTMDGNLLIADLKKRDFTRLPADSNNMVLKNNVSCISWSAKGKQLVAGLFDGSAYQMKPTGEHISDIPRPPGLEANYHLSSLTWLENDLFLMVQTPSDANPIGPPLSKFYLVTRTKTNGQQTHHKYQALGDPAENYGLNRSPPHHFLLRLRDFPPNLKDILIVSSSASTDIGLFTRTMDTAVKSKKSKGDEGDALRKQTNVFALTELSDDSRRAQLPMSDTMEDTSPIGAALDLSASQVVPKPMPEYDDDDGSAQNKAPLPGLFVLNNEGVLAAWWLVYKDSVVEESPWKNLTHVAQQEPVVASAAGSAFGITAAPSAFGQSAFGASTGSSNAFGSQPAFGAPAFGSSTGGAFGAPSGLGSKPSAWGSPAANTGAPSPAFGSAAKPAFGAPAFGAPAFGAPAFGSTSTPAATGAAFGSPGAPGQRVSPWGSAATTPAFGQPSLSASKPAAAPFSAPTSGGFASFAKAPSGFSGLAAGSGSGENVFGAKPGSSGFGALSKPADTGSAFGGFSKPAETGSAFGQPAQAGSAFGSGSGFQLTSSFKPDTSAQANEEKAPAGGGGSFFGGGFGKVLGEVRDSTPAVPEESMEDEPAPPATQPAAGFALNGLGGDVKKEEKTTATQPTSSEETNKPAPFSNIFGSTTPAFGQPKKEPAKETSISSIPEAPLPPDPTSKTEFRIGDSSASSQSEAPLPPDFLTSKPAADKSADAPLPPDFLPPKPAKIEKATPSVTAAEKNTSEVELPPLEVPESDDEADFSGLSESEDEQETEKAGDGEDETEQPGSRADEDAGSEWTPGSSFNGSPLAMKSKGQQPTSRPLFGEIGNQNVPMFAPPRAQEIPRSPSPVRSAVPAHLKSRPDVSRSVSAPLKASDVLGNRPPPSKPEYNDTMEFRQQEERRRVEELERKEREEEQALIDEDDERNQAYLEQEIVPTKILDEFITREDYIADAAKDSVPFQVEALFRDINSMIDTLGMNARSLQCFIAGHTDHVDEERTRKDLEEPEHWCLSEITDLSRIVERDLAEELEEGSIQDTAQKLRILLDLENDIAKLRLRKDEFFRSFSSALDPEHAAICRSQPLTTEQAAHQNSLRREFASIQKLVAEAEEASIMLRTKLASVASASKGRSGPTVEAVMRTVKKLTAMAEKRSGDVDVLENQMRRMNFGSSIRSRENSPFNTPSKLAMRLGNMSIGPDRPFTPEGSMMGSRAFHNSFSASMRSQGNPFSASIRSNGGGLTPRKKMANYTNDERQRLKENVVKRKEVTSRVKAALEKSGARVYPMD